MRQAGLTDEQIAYYPSQSPFPEKKVPPLNAKQQKTLIGAGLLAKLSYEDENEWVPAWAVQISYVWQQKFPANKIVRIHHEYSPFITAGPGASYMDENLTKTYCADGDFLKAWKRLGSHGRFGGANQVSYILRSANTWKNGIEDFTLNLVKKNPDEVVSLCFPGSFSKINPTTLQVHLKNFKPKRDLEVFFGNVGRLDGNEGVAPRLQAR
ncbi:MAG TPA: hypothetical protein DCW29_07830 [Janthinobacterium sp.]|nr:hypothetical protein [Janthinobacterium sp.]